MGQLQFTTPFGRRPASLGQIAAGLRLRETVERAAEPGSNHPAAVNKWRLMRTLSAVRERLGVADRTLGLLSALLSFHPETALTLPAGGEDEESACGLVVFPSNRQLGLRAHGMAEKTIRRHLAALVAAGLIVRRDSPNGKRYARRAREEGAESFSEAYGFDLTPLVARAPEFDALEEEVRRTARTRAVLKERITLQRRDAAKLLALALDEQLPGPWDDHRRRFLDLARPLRGIRDDAELAALSVDMETLRAAVAQTLEESASLSIMTGNDGGFDRHQSDSKTQPPLDLEPASKESGTEVAGNVEEGLDQSPGDLPIGLVLEACPDVGVYAPGGGLHTWPQFLAAARTIRPMLGISPDAWREAAGVMGEPAAAVAVAIILQRSEHSSEAERRSGPEGRAMMSVNGSPAIASPGGYLRALTEKARAGTFRPGAVLMALIGQRLTAKRAASR